MQADPTLTLQYGFRREKKQRKRGELVGEIPVLGTRGGSWRYVIAQVTGAGCTLSQ